VRIFVYSVGAMSESIYDSMLSGAHHLRGGRKWSLVISRVLDLTILGGSLRTNASNDLSDRILSLAILVLVGFLCLKLLAAACL